MSRTSWFVSLSSGLLFSEAGTPAFFTASMLQGVRCDRLHLGVGAGYDVYDGWQTFPVFAGMGWDIVQRGDHAVFVQAQGGFARAWNTYPPEISSTIIDDGGYFLYPMLGYRADAGKLNIHFLVGYKFQRLHYEQDPVWRGWRSETEMKTSVVRDMQRLTVQIALGIH